MGHLEMKSALAVFKNRRVLVTGDTGFKGSWLSYWLDLLGAKVAGYALPPQSAGDLFNRLGLVRRIQHVNGDIRDRRHLLNVFARFRPDFVFHLAAQSLVRVSYTEPIRTIETNVAGSANLLDAVRLTASVRSLVYITSDKCYLNKERTRPYSEGDELGGHDPYSASKAAAELVFASYRDSYFASRKQLGAATARAGNVIGGGDWAADRIVPDSIRALQKNKPIEVRNPSAVRPWQHVLDPLYGYLLLASRLLADPSRYSSSWNFGPSLRSSRTVRDVVSRIICCWGEGTMRHTPQKKAPHESIMLRLNCAKAQRHLGWTPLWDVDRSIEETVKWYSHVHAGGSAPDITEWQIRDYMAGRS